MSKVRSTYHIKIDGNGFNLRGAPSSPVYRKEQAPSLVNQLGVGDLNYNSLNGSGWSYWSQIDWSGGFQQVKFKDNATYKNSIAIDPLSTFGEIKLQHPFTSGASLSGHAVASRSVHKNELLIGSKLSAGAQVFGLSATNTVSVISAYTANISAVNDMSRFKDDTLVGLSRISGSIDTLAKYDGATLSGIRSANPIVRSVKGIGIRAYTGERVSSLSGDVLYHTTDLSTYTSAYQAGKNRDITHIFDLLGSPYMLVREGNKVELNRYDEFSELTYPIYEWTNLTDYGVTKYFHLIVITGKSNGKNVAFGFNGARLYQIFTDQLEEAGYDLRFPFEYEGNLQTRGMSWDGQFWFPGLEGEHGGNKFTPFADFANRAYGFATSASNTILGFYDTTKFATSGKLTSSEFGHNIGGVDKLVNSVEINVDALQDNESVEYKYSTDKGSTFTSLGVLSKTSDGAIKNKKLYFPSGFTSKLWNYQLKISGGGTTTPTVKDITHEYRSAPDLKKRWRMSLDAGDAIQLLNKQSEEREGYDIMASLWLKKEQKKTVPFQDVNSFDVNFVSAMTSAATSASVNSNRLMSRQGRMRVKVSGVVEEMIYTSADGNKIRGITRAQKSTKARAYTTAHSVDNHYDVYITQLEERVNNTDQNKTESVAQITLLEI